MVWHFGIEISDPIGSDGANIIMNIGRSIYLLILSLKTVSLLKHEWLAGIPTWSF